MINIIPCTAQNELTMFSTDFSRSAEMVENGPKFTKLMEVNHSRSLSSKESHGRGQMNCSDLPEMM